MTTRLLRFELLDTDDHGVLGLILLSDQTDRVIDASNAQQTIVLRFSVANAANIVDHQFVDVWGDFHDHLKALAVRGRTVFRTSREQSIADYL